ncbi:MAG: helix-turn-helix domain-containing protein [Spirochaetaceae bacterium]
MAEPAVFQGSSRLQADTCEPLKAAAASGALRLDAWAHGTYPGLPLPPDLLPGLSSVGVWDAHHQQSWGLGWHYNEGIELTFVLRGKVPFSAGADELLLHPGHMTITRPWQHHRVGNPYVPPSTLAWFIIDVGVRRPNQDWTWPEWLVFSAADRERLTTLLRRNEQPVWYADRAVRDRFQRLADTLHRSNVDEISTRIAVAVNDVLLEVLELFRKRDIAQDESLCSSRRTVGLFLDELTRRCEQPWALEEMAASCGLGRTQFSRYCRSLTNMTPLEYLTACRHERAKRLLLEEPSLSIIDVAFRSGFNSSQYFATSFAAYAGCSPTRFRGRG